MMDDLISRKEVLNTIGEPHPMDYNACSVVSLAKDIPAVDTIPVKHGRWEGDETCDAYDIAGVKTWAIKRKCSICGFTHRFIEAHMCYEFCPNCGAKMDLEE